MISIIIPIWNSGAFLNECLDSISSQTEKDWECLLIDDGSQDNSFQICQQWSKRDSRFIFLQQSHLGVSAARNKGIKASRGEYIVFVDSDDFVSSKYIESLLITSSADLVVAGCVKCFLDGDKGHEFLSPSFNSTFTITPQNESLFADLNRKFLLYGPCAKLFKADIVKNNQVYFPENRSLGEDIEFNYQYLRHIDTISCITACEYYYQIRIDRESLSSGRRPDQFDSDIAQWRIIKNFCEDRGIYEKEMRQLLARRLWEIVYDSLFFVPPAKSISINYYRHILGLPEIKFLTKYKDVYPCSRWIKSLVLNRSAMFFYLYGRLSGRCFRKDCI